jgi:arginyl-tRNA synthetase
MVPLGDKALSGAQTMSAEPPRSREFPELDGKTARAHSCSVPLFSDLEARFRAAIAVAFGDEHAGASPQIRRSVHADYQANVALGLASALKSPPRAVAQALLEKLDLNDLCENVAIAGPGYLNLTVRAEVLSREIARIGEDPRRGVVRSGAPETVVIDYSSPNVAKELHVGHLRGTILGDAISRVLELAGHKVVRQNHLGDWGTPFGMLIEEFLVAGSHAIEVGEWNEFYRAARTKFDSDPAFAERARQRVVELQSGEAKTLGLWRELIAQSRAYLSNVYGTLGVKLKDGDVAGESLYNSMLSDVAFELEKQTLAVVDQGALCVFPQGFKSKTGEPLPLIVRKQDGGYGYAATDLAAIRHRTQTLGATRILYVVGAPQQMHLSMVFAVAQMAGWLVAPARAEHVAFGAVLGADKKMLKTRSGENVSLSSLLDEAIVRATAVVQEKNPELDETTRNDVARRVGIGAVKYADLSTDRIKDYVFDWDRMLAFEGNTAPYLQYAYARIRSIFRKREIAALGAIDPKAVALAHPAERALALELLDFPAVVASVETSLEPHKLCGYLYALATAFNGFYQQCPVVRADNEAQQRSRLALSDTTAATLALGLSLLGIDVPEQM